jgi:iron-sulfur cluster assembly accessory protein
MQSVEIAFGFRHHIFDHRRNDSANGFVHDAVLIEIGIEFQHFAKGWACQWNITEIDDLEQSGAKAIINVMRIICYVVRDRRDLRFHGRKLREFKIADIRVVDDGLRHPALLISADGVAMGIDQRAVVFHKSLQCFPCQVQAIKLGVTPLQMGNDAKGLGIVIKPAIFRHQLVKGALACMTKGRVAQIMGQCQGFGEIFIHTENTRDGPGNLRHFKCVGEAGSKVVTLVIDKHLCFVFQPPKRRGMDDAVPVPCKGRPGWTFRFGKQPAPAFLSYAGVAGQMAYHLSHPALDISSRNPDISSMSTPAVSLTPAAAKRILQITGGVSGKALRVAVNGGGCSGFSYEFGIAEARAEDDLAFELDGATVLVDQTSLQFVAGSVLDFEDNLMGQSFKMRNPLAKSSCGCGTSFSF